MACGGDAILTAATLAQDLPEKLREIIQSSTLAIAGLECAPFAGPLPEHRPQKPFSFPVRTKDAITWFKKQNIHYLTHANNHAEDAGSAALAPALAELRSTGLHVTGSGADLASALRPMTLEHHSLQFAFFSINLVNTETFCVSKDRPGTLSLPEHASPLAAAMAAARQEGKIVIVFPHWGFEGHGHPSDGQRDWARWLIDHGAAAIAGSGPHGPQGIDAWRGRPICWSMGNLHAHQFGPPSFATRGLLRLAFAPDGLCSHVEWVE